MQDSSLTSFLALPQDAAVAHAALDAPQLSLQEQSAVTQAWIFIEDLSSRQDKKSECIEHVELVCRSNGRGMHHQIPPAFRIQIPAHYLTMVG